LFCLLACACFNQDAIAETSKKINNQTSCRNNSKSNGKNTKSDSRYEQTHYDTADKFGEYDDEYEFKGTAPINIVGEVKVDSHNMTNIQDIISNTITLDAANKLPVSLDSADKAKKDYPGFNALSLSTAKMKFTLQHVFKNMKSGVDAAVTAKPGKVDIDQITMYIKKYIPDFKMKMSLRAGYIYGAERRLETLGHGTFRTSGLFAFPDYLVKPNVLCAPRVNTDSGKGAKITGKVKKIFNKNTNFVVSLSYTPQTYSKGTKYFEDPEDIAKGMKNHIGFGMKLMYKMGDFAFRTSATVAHGTRIKNDFVEFNNATGIMLGHNMMYKSLVGFGINYGVSLNKDVKNYKVLPDDKMLDNVINNDSAKGGYVISPGFSVIIPQMKNLELFASYMYANRATAWRQRSGDKQIHAKSHIFTTGFGIPIRKVNLGGKLEYVKMNNPAHRDEMLINALLNKADKFDSVENKGKNNNQLIVSLFLKVKVSHEVDKISK